MDFRAAAREEPAPHSAVPGRKAVFVGFDGFVDTIVTPVGLRTGRSPSLAKIRAFLQTWINS